VRLRTYVGYRETRRSTTERRPLWSTSWSIDQSGRKSETRWQHGPTDRSTDRQQTPILSLIYFLCWFSWLVIHHPPPHSFTPGLKLTVSTNPYRRKLFFLHRGHLWCCGLFWSVAFVNTEPLYLCVFVCIFLCVYLAGLTLLTVTRKVLFVYSFVYLAFIV